MGVGSYLRAKVSTDTIIFLDIDGVLNSRAWYWSKSKIRLAREFRANYDARSAFELTNLDPVCVRLLGKLILETHSKIVVTSTWREGRSAGHFQKLFSIICSDFPKESVIGCTPVLDEIEQFKRAAEVSAWLNMVRFEGRYLLLDDDAIFASHPGVLIDRNVGLTNEDATQVKTEMSKET